MRCPETLSLPTDPLAAAITAWRTHDACLQELFAEAMKAWRASQGTKTTKRRTAHGSEIETTSQSHGRTSFLALAARLSEMRMKAAGYISALEAQLASRTRTEPPVGGCTPKPMFSPQRVAELTQAIDTSTLADNPYDVGLESALGDVHSFSTPAQSRKDRRKRERLRQAALEKLRKQG